MLQNPDQYVGDQCKHECYANEDEYLLILCHDASSCFVDGFSLFS